MDPTRLVAPEILVPVAAAVVVLVGIGIAVFKVIGAKRRARALEPWMHGAYSIWTGGEDCATWNEGRAQQSLTSWYGASGPGAFWEVIAELRRGQTGSVAWDRVRALDLLRVGVAARFIDADQCSTEGAKICKELQAQYRSWDELAHAFEAGMQTWQRSRGLTDPRETARVQRNLPKLRQEIWTRIAYDAPLPTDD